MTVYKQTSEKIPLSVDFKELLPTGETLQATSAITIFDSEGVDKTSVMLVSTTIGSTRLDAVIQAGASGNAYKVKFKAVSQLYVFEEIIGLNVLDFPPLHNYEDYVAELQSLIKDDPPKLTIEAGGDLDKILAKAIRDFSSHKPFSVKKKIQGNGTSEYVLYTIFTTLWKHGYSVIKEIEYPIGSKPREILDPSLYEIYDDGSAQDGTNLKLRFTDVSPQAGTYFIAEIIVEMNLPRAGVQNFPDTDENFSNITVLSAAYACQRLAAAYAQSSDATISADVVNYHDKSSRYQSLARQYLKQYNLAVFGEEEPKASVVAAMASKPMRPSDSVGEPYLFHRRK